MSGMRISHLTEEAQRMRRVVTIAVIGRETARPGRQVEPPRAAITGDTRPLDAVEVFEFVQEASQRYRLQVETLGQPGLGQTLVFCKVYDDRRARLGHSGYPGTKRSVIDLAPKSSGVVQKTLDSVWVTLASRFRQYTTELRCRPGYRRLLQQLPGGRLLYPVAMHDLSHDRFGEELIKRRLVGWGPSRRRARGGLCVNCGYDLRATADVICPECGNRRNEL